RHLDLVLESVGNQDDAVVGEDRRASPLPFLDDLRVGFVDDFPYLGEGLSSPVGEPSDQLIDVFARIHCWPPETSGFSRHATEAFEELAVRCGWQQKGRLNVSLEEEAPYRHVSRGVRLAPTRVQSAPQRELVE